MQFWCISMRRLSHLGVCRELGQQSETTCALQVSIQILFQILSFSSRKKKKTVDGNMSVCPTLHTQAAPSDDYAWASSQCPFMHGCYWELLPCCCSSCSPVMPSFHFFNMFVPGSHTSVGVVEHLYMHCPEPDYGIYMQKESGFQLHYLSVSDAPEKSWE